MTTTAAKWTASRVANNLMSDMNTDSTMAPLITLAEDAYRLNLPLLKTDTQRLIAYREEISAQRRALAELRSALHAVYKGLSSEKDGEFWTAAKWCKDRDLYVDNLQGLRVLEEVARRALAMNHRQRFHSKV